MRTSLVTVAALIMSSMAVTLGGGCIDATTIYYVDGDSPLADGAADAGDAPETTTPDGSRDGE